ncbi:MAG: acyltransferase [Clostridia bacterium]|nr:acyltransferase [Clostridia bacterium]
MEQKEITLRKNNNNPNEIATQRIIYLDCARALCMLYIIAVHHIEEYLQNPIFSTDNGLRWDASITTVVLGTFSFLSGFFLLNGRIKNKTDMYSFIKKRVLRIYPLFLISTITLTVISLLLGEEVSILKFLLTLLGVVCYVMPPPMTIWYVSMIISFYIFSMFLLTLGNKYRWLLSIAIYLLFIIVRQFEILNIDDRILVYWPVYNMGGIVASKKRLLLKIKKLRFILIPTVLMLIGIIFFDYYSIIKDTLLAALGVPIVLFVAIQLEKVLYLGSVLTKVSYASFVAYLFHRQYFAALHGLLGKISLTCALFVWVPILLLISYYVQKVYDVVIHKLLEVS